ncbi:MAG: M24 family metallopeptidase [Pseudomonadota bacterium]
MSTSPEQLSTQGIAAGWHPDRVTRVRALLANHQIDALIVPRWDRHHFEYVPLANEWLAYLTGFSGSWGMGILTQEELILFVDGRYQEQAHSQPNAAALQIFHLHDYPPAQWLEECTQEGWRIAFDAQVLSPTAHDQLAKACKSTGATLLPVVDGFIDDCWPERPAYPLSLANVVSDEWAGQSVTTKCDAVAEWLRCSGAAFLVDVLPDNVAWLLNLRGRDLDYCPVLLGRILISDDGKVDLFANAEQLADAERALSERVTLHQPNDFLNIIAKRAKSANTILLDGTQGPQAAREMLERHGIRVLQQTSAITHLKAIKNATELGSMADAAMRESGAWVQLLHWLDRQLDDGLTPSEFDVEGKLEEFRWKIPDYCGCSFRTISAADGNAAHAHYAAPAEGGRLIRKESIFLLDAGGQYRSGGTTDTTRTWCFSEASPEALNDATLALKGHIALAGQTFPDGTLDHNLDVLARSAAWQHYRDYDHGTGHGVGHFLSVHEFPQRLRKEVSGTPLREGMVITIEPGLYRNGVHGIRHEILYEIVAAPQTGWLKFKPLAFVPFCRLLIDLSLLDESETAWIDHYHQQTREQLSTLGLSADERRWLLNQTRPL